MLAGDRKLAGILAEQSGSGSGSGDVLVIGIGLNVATPSDALPVSPGGLRATSLLAEYRSLCATLGRHVRAELPGGRVLSGTAEDVDTDGRLLIREDATAGVSPVSAGDITHLR